MCALVDAFSKGWTRKKGDKKLNVIKAFYLNVYLMHFLDFRLIAYEYENAFFLYLSCTLNHVSYSLPPMTKKEDPFLTKGLRRRTDRIWGLWCAIVQRYLRQFRFQFLLKSTVHLFFQNDRWMDWMMIEGLFSEFNSR